MQKNSSAGVRNPLLLCTVILGLMAALVIVPHQFRSEAGGKKVQKGLVQKTVSHEEGIDNYDIREDKAAFEKIEGFRQSQNKDAVAVADIRSEFVRGEQELKTRIPDAKVEYNSDIRTPEVITPDVWKNKVEMLTAPSSEKRSEILRNFVKENDSLIGVSTSQADSLKVVADYTNPDGNMSFAHLEQRINDVPVFRGEVKAGFTKDGRVIRVINNLAAGLDYGSLSTDFRDPLDAVKLAAGFIKYDLGKMDLNRNGAVSDDLKTTFGNGDWATTAEKMYFPTEPGVARAAWRVLIWEPVRAYYVIVDAQDGTMLWRKNLTNDQTQAATYNVYSSTQNLGLSMDSPAPSLGPLDPSTNFQAPLGTRSNVTLIGNEGSLSFNNLGWITDGTNGTDGFTDGNAVQAGLDIDGTNGVDAPQNGTARVFNFAYTPGNVTGGVDGGDPNNGAAIRSGAVTQLFYFNNRYHDALYKVGFTEPARNFQLSNFGRGGAENDRVSGEAQDSSGTNNANFATPAD
ncbi:MAG: M36 family metallopeptidase, partial [Actinomycetota bacterium]